MRVGLLAIGPRGPLLTAILIGVSLSLGGCSVSKLDNLFAQKDGAQDVTGALGPKAVHVRRRPTDADLAFARNAASDVLTKGGKDSSQPWENPSTGARGSVTPLASAYSSDGRTCRDFLASYVNGTSEAWLQGAACRADGRWEIQSLKPWKES